MAQYTAKPATLAAIAAKLPAALKAAFNMNLIIDDFSFVTRGDVNVEIFFKEDSTRYAHVGTVTIDKAKDFVDQVADYIKDKDSELLAMIDRRAILTTVATKNA